MRARARAPEIGSVSRRGPPIRLSPAMVRHWFPLAPLVALAMPIANARAETLPELPPDENVVMLLDSLAPGEALRLPEFTVTGDGLDAFETFATRGPGIRDFCNKWVWAEDRGRALYAGGNHGAPHKLNDLWEYDLESNTWLMLHAPDPDVSPSHTWWGFTYDQARARVYWMAPATPGAWDAGDYEGPPLRVYDTQAPDGWGLVMTEPPHIRVSLAAALEYIPNRDVMLFHSNQWNGSGLQQYDPVANAWTQLIPQAELYFDNPDAPPAEAIITYNSVDDVLVGFLDRSVYVYDFDANAWTRVLEDAIPEGLRVSDSVSGSDYDPFSNVHYVLTGGLLFAYDVASNTMTDLQVEEAPDFGMAYFDREHAVLVMYDESSSHVVYRHAAAPDPDPGQSESGSDDDGGSSSEDGTPPPADDDGSTTDASAGETTSPGSTSDVGTSDAPEGSMSDDSGCGCRSSAPGGALGWLALLALLTLRRRGRG